MKEKKKVYYTIGYGEKSKPFTLKELSQVLEDHQKGLLELSCYNNDGTYMITVLRLTKKEYQDYNK
jgi:hypothetical protein